MYRFCVDLTLSQRVCILGPGYLLAFWCSMAWMLNAIGLGRVVGAADSPRIIVVDRPGPRDFDGWGPPPTVAQS